jgi:hypothetical protein
VTAARLLMLWKLPFLAVLHIMQTKSPGAVYKSRASSGEGLAL